MSKRKLWIDTDAGTDDAVALIMAMRDSTVDIVGISTSGGNVPLDCVVQNVLYIRELCNDAAPVYRGAAQPLTRILDTADFIHGKDGLGDIGLSLSDREHDVGEVEEKIYEALQVHDDLEIVCLGPLTNLAKTSLRYPSIVDRAKSLYVMGGLVDLPGNVTPLAEYNIWADPEAAAHILSKYGDITLIGWDTTLRSAAMGPEDIHDIYGLGTSLAKFVMDIQQVRLKWMEEYGEEKSLLLADALAMAVVLRPDYVLNSARYKMTVDPGLEDESRRGYIECHGTEDEKSVLHISEVDQRLYTELLHQSLV